MYCVHIYCLHVYDSILRFSRSESIRLFRRPSYTCAHIKYPSSLCVCTRIYKHTPTHHPNTCKNREIYKTKPLFLPLPNHSLPRQQQALTMNKPELEKTPTSNPHTRMHACSREIGQYNSTKCAYTSAYVHSHAYVFTCICIHIHRHTYIHIHTCGHANIHTYMHTRMHIHVYAHLYTDQKCQQRRLNVSSNIIDAHTYPYTYVCIYIYICIYTNMCTLH